MAKSRYGAFKMIRKRKKNIPVIERYEIEADDWEADYFFGLAPQKVIEGVYWEGSSLIITGKFDCSVPSYSLPYLAQAVHAKKIKYISITGTKLRYKQGTIRHISLSSQKED